LDNNDEKSYIEMMNSGPCTQFRWVVGGLLFFAAAIKYIDRQIIGILKPNLQKEFIYLLAPNLDPATL